MMPDSKSRRDVLGAMFGGMVAIPWLGTPVGGRSERPPTPIACSSSQASSTCPQAIFRSEEEREEYVLKTLRVAVLWLIQTRHDLRNELEAGDWEGNWADVGITAELGHDELDAIRASILERGLLDAAARTNELAEVLWDPPPKCCPDNPTVSANVEGMVVHIRAQPIIGAAESGE